MQRRRFALLVLSIGVACLVLFGGRRSGGEFSGGALPDLFLVPGLRVQIDGDVAFPGVYRFCDNTLTVSAIELAGARCADKVRDELAGRILFVHDGMRLSIVCRSGDSPRVLTVGEIPPATAFVLGIPFDLNRASAQDLDLLPGVGPALAERIVMYRQKNGDFVRLEQLMQVEGIGEKKYQKLKKYLKCA